MGEYVKVAETKDVLKNQMQVFNVKGREILVVNVEGEFYAFDNRCPHMGYPLFFGSLEGDTLICGFHSAKFNIKTGKSLGLVTSESLKTSLSNSKTPRYLLKFESSECGLGDLDPRTPARIYLKRHLYAGAFFVRLTAETQLLRIIAGWENRSLKKEKNHRWRLGDKRL